MSAHWGKKDDPWFMAKLSGVHAREAGEMRKAAKRRTDLAAKGMRPDRFVVCKYAIDGTGDQWGHRYGETLDGARCLRTYPPGKHIENGREYVWSYYVDER
jgi:hypothetical protein